MKLKQRTVLIKESDIPTNKTSNKSSKISKNIINHSLS